MLCIVYFVLIKQEFLGTGLRVKKNKCLNSILYSSRIKLFVAENLCSTKQITSIDFHVVMFAVS